MDGSETGEKRICPVCDEAVSMETKICPSCSTDLTLFSTDEAQADVDTEELKQSLLSDGNGHVSELLRAADEEPLPAGSDYAASVECPECGKAIPEDAIKCPHCGVEFEYEEMFECPMCKSVLEVTVTKCPSCGAEFEDEPAEAPAPAAPAEPAPKPEPTSFAERLKQVNEEPGQAPPAPVEPKKELSFAERMKAMKDGKTPEPTPVAQPPASTPSPKPSTPPAAPAQSGLSLSDRVKSLQQGAPAPTAQPPPVEKPEPYRDLPRYIGEVKRLLALANEQSIDVSTSKAVINKAVTAGKNKDMDSAIKLVKEGKEGIERALRTTYTSKLRTLESALGLERKAGKDVSGPESSLTEARRSLEANDFQAASNILKSLEDSMMKSPSSKLSQAELEAVSCALQDAEFLQVNVSEAKTLLDEAMKAAAQNEAQKSHQLTQQAAGSLNRVLPTFIAGEMRKAKVALREIKMMNVDITAPVQMLKDANDHVNRGDYCAALGHIKSFREFVQKVAP